MKKSIIILALLSIISLAKAQSLKGTTWSYQELIERSSEKLFIKIYFTFVSDIDVLWYYGTPEGTFFPVGFGRLDSSNNTILFSCKNHLHKNISLYRNNTDYKFQYIYKNGRLKIKYIGNSIDLFPYNIFKNLEFDEFKKEVKSLIPNSKLAKTSWSYKYNDKSGYIYFASKYVAYFNGEKVPYVCVGDIVSIKSGDNITDESFIGMYNTNKISLYRTGTEGLTDICIIINKR